MDESNRFLIVSLDGEGFAIPIAILVEITALRKIQKDPNLAELFEGKLEYRDHMIPVADLKKILRLPGRPGRSLLVVKSSKGMLGFLVDVAAELLTAAQGPAPLPPGIMGSNQAIYAGILRNREDLVLLLNVEGLLA